MRCTIHLDNRIYMICMYMRMYKCMQVTSESWISLTEGIASKKAADEWLMSRLLLSLIIFMNDLKEVLTIKKHI